MKALKERAQNIINVMENESRRIGLLLLLHL